MAAWARRKRVQSVVAKVGIADKDENARVVARLETMLLLDWPSLEEPMFELDANYTVHVYKFNDQPPEIEGEPSDPAFCELYGLLVDALGNEIKFSARRYSTFADGGDGWPACTIV